ncbi:murein DD-endopeptidase MepM/ murein hydrolase activator NlpD [Mycetocola sp. CAN_C7]|uniref:M23 family metallopeptidase n=1 Tax=Mycetocola sp. CAN_C7 TaxID=2787724 RepID=UPI0018CB85E1
MTDPLFRSTFGIRGRLSRGRSVAPRAARPKRTLRATAVLLLAVPALVGAAALPAHAIAPTALPGAVPAAVSTDGNYMHDANAQWLRPVPGRVTSKFGPRPIICNPAGCSSTIHEGIDFGSPCGTAIKAVSPGVVTFSGDGGAFGQRVIVDHGAGVSSVYGHAQVGSLKMKVGQQVKAGTVVANVGATGVATGCHLDLKIRVGGVFVDPAPWMAFRGVTLY